MQNVAQGMNVNGILQKLSLLAIMVDQEGHPLVTQLQRISLSHVGSERSACRNERKQVRPGGPRRGVETFGCVRLSTDRNHTVPSPTSELVLCSVESDSVICDGARACLTSGRRPGEHSRACSDGVHNCKAIESERPNDHVTRVVRNARHSGLI